MLAPFNVLVLPFHQGPHGDFNYAIFNRSDGNGDVWQGVAGGTD